MVSTTEFRDITIKPIAAGKDCLKSSLPIGSVPSVCDPRIKVSNIVNYRGRDTLESESDTNCIINTKSSFLDNMQFAPIELQFLVVDCIWQHDQILKQIPF